MCVVERTDVHASAGTRFEIGSTAGEMRRKQKKDTK
jgi:hypothetical protein